MMRRAFNTASAVSLVALVACLALSAHGWRGPGTTGQAVAEFQGGPVHWGLHSAEGRFVVNDEPQRRMEEAEVEKALARRLRLQELHRAALDRWKRIDWPSAGLSDVQRSAMIERYRAAEREEELLNRLVHEAFADEVRAGAAGTRIWTAPVSYSVPAALPVAAAAVLPAAWAWRAFLARRRRTTRRARGLCLRCGYDVRASAPFGRCPECGAEITEPPVDPGRVHMKVAPVITLAWFILAAAPGPFTAAAAGQPPGAEPFHKAELIFPLEHWHNHGSCIVEAPGGDLLVCWFNGSGERTADDVKIEGARLKKGASAWSPRFTLADTPGYPDTNCCMFIDPQERLWLLWPTILANEWHTALMKYRIASRYDGDARGHGPPQWEVNEVLHVTPGPEFETTVSKVLDSVEAGIDKAPPATRAMLQTYVADARKHTADKLFRRLGWMTRAHPFVLDEKRLIVPLYSDGFSFSLMAFTDDWGATWKTSTPLVGAGNIQPSIVRRKDGSLYTLMRDNGPPPKRLMASESRDRGETWSPVVDSDLPNPGGGAEIINLRGGHWALIYNDTEQGRHSLAVAISDDDGKTWKWKRHLESQPAGNASGRFHYPSIIQAKDGTLHASYSYHLNENGADKDAEGKPRHKSIKHAHFNTEWVMAGDGR